MGKIRQGFSDFFMLQLICILCTTAARSSFKGEIEYFCKLNSSIDKKFLSLGTCFLIYNVLTSLKFTIDINTQTAYYYQGELLKEFFCFFIEASYFDQINMTKNGLEYDQIIFTIVISCLMHIKFYQFFN